MKTCSKCKLNKVYNKGSWCRSCDNLRSYNRSCGECSKPITRKNKVGLCLSCGKKGERHPMFGKEFKKGKDHPSWKGDSVGYHALHSWIKRNKKKQEKCEYCKEEKKLDLANKSNEYKRDTNDWLWLCRKCHKKHDNSTIPKGEKHHATTLTKSQVIDIYHLSSTNTLTDLSKQFNVSIATIYNIKNGKTWKHLHLKGELLT